MMPLSDELMYMFVTTPEPDNPHFPDTVLAVRMREWVQGCGPKIRALGEAITEDDKVVYRPLEPVLVEGPWSRGRIVLLGDAVHTRTPQVGQGAGMAIEDAIVLTQELDRHDKVDAAFSAYRAWRFERCAWLVRSGIAICHGQIGKGPSSRCPAPPQRWPKRHLILHFCESPVSLGSEHGRNEYSFCQHGLVWTLT